LAIDHNRLNNLHREARELLDALADRLPSGRVERLRTFSDVGEEVLLVNGLCASLIKREIPITLAERDALARVLALFETPVADADHINDPDATLAAVSVVD
jgi:hypothetical protein